MGKRYFWLKLREDFFRSKQIRMLYNVEDGDMILVIYLKMMLLTLQTEGIYRFDGMLDFVSDEIAMEIGDEPNAVLYALANLVELGLVIPDEEVKTLFIPAVVANTGSETAATQRWREWRDRRALDSNTTPTLPQQNANGEIEKEPEIETEIDPDTEKKADVCVYSLPAPGEDAGPTGSGVDADCRETPCLPPSNDTSSAPLQRENGRSEDARFSEFWDSFPRKTGDIRGAAFAFMGVIDSGVSADRLIGAVRQQVAAWDPDKLQYFPSPEKWLKNRQWTDTVVQPTVKPSASPISAKDLEEFMREN